MDGNVDARPVSGDGLEPDDRHPLLYGYGYCRFCGGVEPSKLLWLFSGACPECLVNSAVRNYGVVYQRAVAGATPKKLSLQERISFISQHHLTPRWSKNWERHHRRASEMLMAEHSAEYLACLAVIRMADGFPPFRRDELRRTDFAAVKRHFDRLVSYHAAHVGAEGVQEAGSP